MVRALLRTVIGGCAILAALATHAEGSGPPRDPILRQIVAIVERDFYSADVLRARDWPRLVKRADAALRRAHTPDARSAAIQALLAGLATSHTAYFARSDPRRADLAAIFQPVLERNAEHCPPERRPAFPIRSDEIGVWWERLGEAWFVAGLLDGGPAQQAGLLLGDEVVAADGEPFEPVEAFAGKATRSVRLSVRRQREGPLATHEVVVRSSEPLAAYAAATRKSAHVIERGAARIGYVRLWSGVGDAPAEARAGIRELNAKGVDGLVLDLREGWGGVPPDFVSIFDRAVPQLVTRTRDEELHFDGQVRTPAVVLINERVRSGKEVLAYAIRKHRLATLLGTRTPGALLPGTAYCLEDGALLYLAVGTITIDGEEREGRGIDPDIAVPFDVRYAAGRDAQLEAAVEHLAKRGSGAPTPDGFARRAQHEQGVGDDRAGNRRLHQHVLPGAQGSDRDDQLGEVAQRGVEQAPHGVARLGCHGFRGVTEQSRQRHDGQNRQREEQRVRFGLELRGDEYRGDEGDQPEQRIVKDLLKEQLHGFTLDALRSW